MKARNILIALAIELKGDWNSIYNAIQSKNTDDILSKYTDEDLDKVKCLTLLDEDYPEYLKQQYQPPFVLFYDGNINLLKADRKIAVLGTRNPDEIYLDFTKSFITNLPKGNVVVVTDTKGICEKAALSAICSDKEVIVVSSAGIKVGYSFEEEVSNNIGLTISEYPGSTPKSQNQCIKRCGLVAGIANIVCSIQIHDHSGSLFTINQALSQGKEVYCVPNLTDIADTNNRLIDEGANTLTLSTTL